MFMQILEQAFQGVFSIWFTTLTFPEPIGSITAADLMLFLTACYLIADTVGTIAERRD